MMPEQRQDAQQCRQHHHRDLRDQQQLAFVQDVAQRTAGQCEQKKRRVGGDLDQRHHERRRRERRHQPCRADIVDVSADRREHVGRPKPPKHRQPKRRECGGVFTMLAHPDEC